jgi:transposase
MDLTDQQWTIIEPLFEEKRRPGGRGRPWRDARAVLNGVLWVLRTGAPWPDLMDHRIGGGLRRTRTNNLGGTSHADDPRYPGEAVKRSCQMTRM